MNAQIKEIGARRQHFRESDVEPRCDHKRILRHRHWKASIALAAQINGIRSATAPAMGDQLAIFPIELLDLNEVRLINIRGRGGKEAHIDRLLPAHLGWQRAKLSKDKRLYDYYNAAFDLRVETKKQENLQWFDVGKYHALSPADQKIVMLFINHRAGIITQIAAIQLSNFVELMVSDYDCSRFGWNREVLTIAHKFKETHPALQFKVQAKIRTLISAPKYRECFDILFELPMEQR